MPALPETVSKAWDDREGAIVLTTVDQQGKPNSIYATCVKKWSDEQLVIADNYFDKTRVNILAGSKAALLFITAEGKAFQVKGTLDYQTEGKIFDDMKQWVDAKHPRCAAVVLSVEEVYSGADQLA